MIETPIYKFKKRQLTDSPPNIEVGEENWDKVEQHMNNLSANMEGREISVNLNEDRIAGKTVTFDRNTINRPTFIQDGYCTYHPYSTRSSHGFQFAQGFNVTGVPQVGIRSYRGDSWDEWEQLATTKKVDISLKNNWVNYTVGSVTMGYSQAYAYRVGDIVQLTGIIISGIQSDNTVIGTLLPQYRPTGAIITYITEGNNWARIDIRANGDITLVSKSGTFARIDLSQISYGIQG